MTARPRPSVDVLDARLSDPIRSPGIGGNDQFVVLKESQCSAALTREITNYLDTQDTSHPFQLPQWSTGNAQLFLLRRQGRIQWFAKSAVHYPAGRVLRPIRALILNRAPVCDDPQLLRLGLEELVRAVRSLGIAYIDLMPEWTGEFAESAGAVLAQNGWQPLPSSRASLRLDLTPHREALFAGFRSGTRYDVRRAEAAGIDVKRVRNEADIREFIQLYVEMAREKEFAAESPDFLLKVFEWLDTDDTRGGFFVAHEGRLLRGGILLLRVGTRCWYVLGATAKDGKISAGHLLQWRGIEWSKNAGCREYDFGGYREESKSGPAFFKRGFCDRVVHFLPPHRRLISEARYTLSELVDRVRRTLRAS